MCTAAAREAAAKLCGLTASAMTSDNAARLLEQLVTAFAAARGHQAAAAAVPDVSIGGASKLAVPAGKDGTAAAPGKAAARYEERDGAMAAAGYVLAQLATGAESYLPSVTMCGYRNDLRTYNAEAERNAALSRPVKMLASLWCPYYTL